MSCPVAAQPSKGRSLLYSDLAMVVRRMLSCKLNQACLQSILCVDQRTQVNMRCPPGMERFCTIAHRAVLNQDMRQHDSSVVMKPNWVQDAQSVCQHSSDLSAISRIHASWPKAECIRTARRPKEAPPYVLSSCLQQYLHVRSVDWPRNRTWPVTQTNRL